MTCFRPGLVDRCDFVVYAVASQARICHDSHHKNLIKESLEPRGSASWSENAICGSMLLSVAFIMEALPRVTRKPNCGILPVP